MCAARERRVWPELAGALLYSPGFSRRLNAHVDGRVLPIARHADVRLSVPYGAAGLPYLRRALYGPDGALVAGSLQALVENAHDRFKAMDMLRHGNALAAALRSRAPARPARFERLCHAERLGYL